MEALLRYPRSQRRAVAQEWARRSHAVQAEARLARGPDDETLRWRGLQDARGQILRSGVTYRATGETPWCVRRAIGGRVNQVEIVVAGRVWRTCSLRAAGRLID